MHEHTKRLFVLKVSGSFVETEEGIDKDFVALHIDGTPRSGAALTRVALVFTLEDAAIATYGLHRMYVELGRGEDFRRAIGDVATRDHRTKN